jgi:hypothetical protein
VGKFGDPAESGDRFIRGGLNKEGRMDSTPNVRQADPHDVLTARADQALAEIYERMTRPDEQPSQAEPDAVPHPSDPQIPVDTFSPATSRDGRVRPAGAVLFLAASICIAVVALQSSYGDAAKLIFVRWLPQLTPTSSQLPERSGPAENRGPSTFQTGAAEPTPAQPETQAPRDVATAAAPARPELAQTLQAIVHDLANMEQGIEQLKASQAQMGRDNAQIAEQVKASQEQMARDVAQIAEQLKASQEQMASIIAKASGRDPRKTSAPPAQPIATSIGKPARTPPLPQGATRPQALSPRLQAPSQPRAGKP